MRRLAGCSRKGDLLVCCPKEAVNQRSETQKCRDFHLQRQARRRCAYDDCGAISIEWTWCACGYGRLSVYSTGHDGTLAMVGGRGVGAQLLLDVEVGERLSIVVCSKPTCIERLVMTEAIPTFQGPACSSCQGWPRRRRVRARLTTLGLAV